MNQERNQEAEAQKERRVEQPNASSERERADGLESFSPSGPLGFFVGDRYNVGHDRTFEWRDALGCVWLPGLIVILSIAIWLGQVGVPTAPLQVGTVVALIGLGIALWLIGRSGKSG